MNTTTRSISRLAISLLAALSARSSAQDYVYEFAPEVLVPHLRNASQSKLFWAADGVVSNGAVAYFRYKFELPSVPVDASLYYYFDDKGTVYLNGHPLLRPGSYAYPFLVAGTNTIACRVLSSLESKHLSVKSAAVLETVLVIAMAIVLVPATRNG